MPDTPASRRALLRSGAAMTGAGLLAALAGCQGMLSEGADETPADDDESDAWTPLAYVPEGATFVATADLDGLRNDEAVRSSTSDLLEGIDRLPDTLTATLDTVQSASGLDLREASGLVVSGAVGRYTAIVRADWTIDALVRAVDGASATESTYAGRTVYTPPIGESGLAIASLGENTFALGGQRGVRNAIDVAQGETAPVAGAVRDQYEATRNGLVRLGATVPEMLRVGATGEYAALSNVVAVRGSITGGESSRVRVRLQTTEETDAVASTVREWIDETGAGIAGNPQVDANRTLGAVVDATTVSTDGSAVLVANDRGIETLVYVGGAILGTFFLGLGEPPRNSIPQALFSYEYDRDAETVTVSHDGGDAIQAATLYVRGRGFTDAAGADLIEPGPWPAGDDGRVEAGDEVIVGLEANGHLRIVYESDERTSRLGEYYGPDA